DFGCGRARAGPRPSAASNSAWSDLQLGQIDPAPLGPALVSDLRELHAPGAGEQIPRERPALRDMPQEQLPLRAESVLVGVVVRNLLPAGEEIDALRNIGIPYRLRGRGARLDQTAPQSGDRRAECAVDLERQKI